MEEKKAIKKYETAFNKYKEFKQIVIMRSHKQ